MVRPLRSAAIQSPFGTRTPEVVPFQVKTTSESKSTFARSGSSPYGALAARVDVLELQLLDDVGDPAFAESSPRPAWSTGRAPEQRPQRHFDRAGVGGRHDADAIIGGDLQHLAREIDGALELRLADLGAVRAAESCVGEGLQAPAGALGAGAGGEVRDGRPHAGLRIVVMVYPSR